MAYNDIEDFENVESSALAFDFKGFLYKAINNWKLILLSIGIALSIAYFLNIRKQNVYKLSSLISVESAQNPFFLPIPVFPLIGEVYLGRSGV